MQSFFIKKQILIGKLIFWQDKTYSSTINNFIDSILDTITHTITHSIREDHRNTPDNVLEDLKTNLIVDKTSDIANILEIEIKGNKKAINVHLTCLDDNKLQKITHTETIINEEELPYREFISSIDDDVYFILGKTIYELLDLDSLFKEYHND